MTGIRKTDGGLEISHRWLQFGAALIVVVCGLGTAMVTLVHKNDALAETVPRAEWLDTLQRQRNNMAELRTNLQQLANEVRESTRGSHDLTCYVYHYPHPFCDDATRQAAR